jgi:hypothetical protein
MKVWSTRRSGRRASSLREALDADGLREATAGLARGDEGAQLGQVVQRGGREMARHLVMASERDEQEVGQRGHLRHGLLEALAGAADKGRQSGVVAVEDLGDGELGAQADADVLKGEPEQRRQHLAAA